MAIWLKNLLILLGLAIGVPIFWSFVDVSISWPEEIVLETRSELDIAEAWEAIDFLDDQEKEELLVGATRILKMGDVYMVYRGDVVHVVGSGDKSKTVTFLNADGSETSREAIDFAQQQYEDMRNKADLLLSEADTCRAAGDADCYLEKNKEAGDTYAEMEEFCEAAHAYERAVEFELEQDALLRCAQQKEEEGEYFIAGLWYRDAGDLEKFKEMVEKGAAKENENNRPAGN